jgi:predicted DNA-binding transcriptional regulator AlpA
MTAQVVCDLCGWPRLRRGGIALSVTNTMTSSGGPDHANICGDCAGQPISDLVKYFSKPSRGEAATFGRTIDVPEAARMLGFSREHVYRSIQRGDFPCRVVKLGRRLKVVAADVIKLLDEAG